MYDQIAQNKRRTALLISVFMILTFAVLAALSQLFKLGAVGIGLAAVAGGVTALVSYWTSDKIALGLSQAHPAPADQYSRLHNLVEGLCIAGGLPKPRIYIVEDAAPNAFATGRNPEHAAIAVTTGLLEKMNRAELEGVLAHELAHIKNYDILISTLIVTMVGMTTMASDLAMLTDGDSRGRRTSRRTSRRSDDSVLGMALALAGFALLLLAPVIGQILQLAVSRNRETLADVSGAALTRYPPGLISALEKLRDDHTTVRSPSRATAHLWIESPLRSDRTGGKNPFLNKLYNTHPPLEERIELLRQL
jgi:heat shock protein HtpX